MIRLSKPAPLTTKPSQTRLLRENRLWVRIWKRALSGKTKRTSGTPQLIRCGQSIIMSFSTALLRKLTASGIHGVMANFWSSILNRATWGQRWKELGWSFASVCMPKKIKNKNYLFLIGQQFAELGELLGSVPVPRTLSDILHYLLRRPVKKNTHFLEWHHR